MKPSLKNVHFACVNCDRQIKTDWFLILTSSGIALLCIVLIAKGLSLPVMISTVIFLIFESEVFMFKYVGKTRGNHVFDFETMTCWVGEGDLSEFVAGGTV